MREARVTAGLCHPGIVAVHDAGMEGGEAYIVYELIEGARTLDQAVEGLDLRRRCELVRDAAKAAGEAHANGVVHRDLKPENMLIDATGRLKIMDFGVAKAFDIEQLTQTGSMVGTPAFMAPEQMLDTKSVGPPTDVWALGVVLYWCLTDRLPFESTSLVELMAQVQRCRPSRPREWNPSVSAAVERVCLRALSITPARRYDPERDVPEIREGATYLRRSSLTTSADGRDLLAIGGSGGLAVYAWGETKLEEVGRWEAPSGLVQSVALTPGLNHMICGYGNAKRSVEKGLVFCSLQTGKTTTEKTAFLFLGAVPGPKGKQILMGDLIGTTYMLDLSRGLERRLLAVSAGGIRAAAVSSTHFYLSVAGGLLGYALLEYDLSGGENAEPVRSANLPDRPNGLDLSPDETRILVTLRSDRVLVYQLD